MKPKELERQRLLLILPVVPWPIRLNGITLRFAPIVDYLGQRYELDLLVLADEDVRQPPSGELEQCHSLVVIKVPSSSLPAWLRSLKTILLTLAPWGAPHGRLRYAQRRLEREVLGYLNDRSYRAIIWATSHLEVACRIRRRYPQTRCVIDLIDSPTLFSSREAAPSSLLRTLTKYNGNQWLYNTIYNTPGGLWVKESVSSGTAAYNYFYSVATTASEIAGYCAAFIGWDGAENSSGPGKLFSLHHNVIEACGASHKPVGGTNPVLTVIGINAYNNTVYDTQTVANVGWLLSCESSTCEFYNNIYMTSKGSSGQLSAQPGKLCVSNGATLFANVNNNCYYDSTGAYSSFWSTAGLGGSGGSAYSSFTSWKSAVAAVVSGSESHSIQSNPNFTLPGGYVAGGGAAQFQLLPGSPCIGTGEGGVNMGAWDGTSSQIGCSFALGSGTGSTAVPSAPTLTVS